MTVRQSGSWSILQTEQREVGWANVWKTQFWVSPEPELRKQACLNKKSTDQREFNQKM